MGEKKEKDGGEEANGEKLSCSQSNQLLGNEDKQTQAQSSQSDENNKD